MPKIHNTHGEEVAPDSKGLSLYFFQTGMEPHIGEVSYFKVMSGGQKSKLGDDLTNADRGSKGAPRPDLCLRRSQPHSC